MQWRDLVQNDGGFAELIRALTLLEEALEKNGIDNKKITCESKELLKCYLDYEGSIVDPEILVKAVLFTTLQNLGYRQKAWELVENEKDNTDWLSLSPVINRFRELERY